MLDKYFYSIEQYGEEKYFHLSGNVYENDVDPSDTNYRIAEWTGLCIPISELMDYINMKDYYDYFNERVNYLDDCTEAEARKIAVTNHNGAEGEYLHIEDLTENTPCGNYWFGDDGT